ncbi:AI-2E family transporter [Paenisporosarcina antarctica]|uniref:AI-2E family transporter n=1 Tax=Paenisporosarcina antarctica TaxID=417367 RepID=A0A4P6ZWN5_9BACL|nr:AI-2E family transporter [Paenisporosarcina antarctica]QBP40673.1 AI-2E family transporter [Paenisporosarcina antarctica]
MYANIESLLKKWLPIVVIVILAWLIYPVTVAILIAYFSYPIVYSFQKVSRLPRWITALFFECALLAFIILVATLVVKELFEIVYPFRFHLEEVLLYANKANWQSVIEGLSMVSESLLKKITLFIQHLPEQFVETFVFLVALFFALQESLKSRTWFFIYIPSRTRKTLKPLFLSATDLFEKFTKVEIKLFLLTFLQLTIGFYAMQFSSPIGLAFLISFADFMPFVGTGVFLIPMAVYFILTQQTTLGIIILLLYAFILLSRQLFESFLWANTMHIRAVHVFFISACSLLLFGVPGILLSPFLLLAAVHFRQHKWFT